MSIERDSRLAFARLLRKLDLHCRQPPPEPLAAAGVAVKPEAMTMPIKRRLSKATTGGPQSPLRADVAPLYRKLGLEYDCSYHMPLDGGLRAFWKHHDIVAIPTYYGIISILLQEQRVST